LGTRDASARLLLGLEAPISGRRETMRGALSAYQEPRWIFIGSGADKVGVGAVTRPEALLTGQFPPGRPLIPGFLWDFWPRFAGPVGSSQGQQGARAWIRIVTSSCRLNPRFPPRPRSLEPARQDPEPPLRRRGRLLLVHNNWTKILMYMIGGPSSQRRPSMASRSRPYLSPLRRRERLLQGRFTEQIVH
jgi:hypothetical protein